MRAPPPRLAPVMYPPPMNVPAWVAPTVAVLAATLVLGGVGCGARSEGTDDRYGGEVASTDTPRGQSRYQVVCAPCHERRTSLNAPSLSHLGWSAARVRRQIREGTALMPPIREARLSDDDMEALLAYFVDIGTVVEAFELEAPVHAEPGHRRSRPDAGVDAPIDVGVDAPSAFVDDWGPDAGATDAGDLDVGATDAGATDAGAADAGATDAGATDAGAPDAATLDGGGPDAALRRGRDLADPSVSGG